MATTSEPTTHIEMPKLPSASASVKDFIPYVSSNPTTPISQLLEPYKAFESELRKVYAQQPDHEAVKDGNVNLVPIFAGHEHEVKIRARALDDETDDEKSKYIMELTTEDRKLSGAPAIVSSFKSFKQNFDLFSESSLADLDWSNVVAAGSSVTTALLPVPEKWASNKRSLREYYHEHLAPASDVDLFIYGLNEEQALDKIKQIERNIRDSILHETTTIRTKNAITIASQYPTRHVQIVLRLYDSISQIITGFDVDCACAAYTGDQVYAAPRAIASFMTQCNTIDLTRRSPSYENRLSKYSRRGFEVHWPILDRTRIDPTIFERSFGRTQGLARLLILEKLPKSEDRDSYMDQRRAERGRPALNRGWRNQHKMGGNIKDQEEDDVAEWVEEEEVASYHTMTVPYGPKYHAAKINRLLYAKDLLLNAEWNQPDDNVRPVYLHRHPCFFGTAEEVLQDCCGFCPVPKTDEEIAIAEEDGRANISGELKFLKDDPGRQEIGSFHPITDDEWTTMAYVGDTARLCEAIVDGDLEHVEDWSSQEGVDVNRRDYTGRTPLHLACMTSTPEIVDCLVEHGARLIARLVDGRTALHIAAARGNAQMVKCLMAKSELNEEQEEEKEEARRAAKKATAIKDSKDEEKDDSDSEASEITLESEDEDDSVTMGSFVKIDTEKQQNANEGVPDDADDQDPDVYDIDVVAWDYGLTPLHLAILNGHLEIIELLVSEYGADVLLPVKLVQPGSSTPRGAIMSILLATYLPTEQAKEVVKLLLDLGASSAQADMNRITVFHYLVNNERQDIINILLEADGPAAQNALKNVSPAPGWGNNVQTPLLTAIENGYQDMVSTLLKIGASPTITFDDWIPVYLSKNEWAKSQSPEQNMQKYQSTVIQPIILAACKEMGKTVENLLAHGADPGSLEKTAYSILENPQNTTYQVGASLLDIVQKKLKTLREYKEPDQNFSRSDKPETLRGEGSYIYGLSEGTYRHWSALSDYQHAKRANKTAWDSYEKSQKKKNDDGVAEKKEAILKLIEELQQTEKTLIEAGAKPFKEMHPELPEPLTYNNNYRYESPDPTPYETSFRFRVPDLNDIKKDGYIKLFEAAWSNDLETIKAMTLAPWAGLENKPVNPPLKIAVQDANGFNPFSIAVLRGHRDLSKKIIEICAAQYHVDDGKTNRQRWTMRTSDDYDEDSESDNDDNLPIFSELVSDRFTFEDIGAVSNVVKSDVAPLTMLEWNCVPQRLHGRKPDQVDDSQYTLLEYAVEVDDMDLLKFIIELGSELQALLAEEDDQRCYIIDYYIFLTAIRLGRTTMLAEMIKETGVGLPLDDFVHKSGVEIRTKPRYYQGLSVSGKKRADWAQAPGNYDYARVVRENVPPLLEAAHLGNLDSVDWFMSSAPSRQYGEFAEKNKHDKRIKALEESGTGFDKTLRTWLGAKTELVLHCAILNSPDKDSTPKYLALIKHLVSVAPETLEQKSSEGWTPLHVAILAQRKEVVSYLISCGANQRSRDKLNRNVIHSLISGQQTNFDEKRSPERLLSLIELFDKQAVKEMMLERCSIAPGALTPLAYWMATNDASYKKSDIAAILCKHSSLEELGMINGEGDLPLHVAIKQGLSTLTSFFLSLKPTLLYRENTTGRTPLEMASDIYIASCVEDPPRISDSYSNFGNIQDRDTIVNKNARDFLPKQPAPEESKKRTWEICEGVDRDMSQNDRKRRLVSLFEANEVAKRVAGLKNSRSRQMVINGGIVDGEVKRDVVSEWI